MSRRANVLAQASAKPKVRLDRWLWAARMFKTRSQAKQAIEGGKVHYNGQRTKPARETEIGAELDITRNFQALTVVVDALSDRRGPAVEAQQLYHETETSITRRATEQERARLQRAGLQQPMGRPDKHDRRALTALKQRGSP
ncbi:MAG: hypothetical protein E2O58_00890 [Gammaproteobacteria bacterium]|nr:MAG: hypothetical protein E2O58_00890 [Gammaproteobacteria bacterium]